MNKLTFLRGWHFNIGTIYIIIANHPNDNPRKISFKCYIIYGCYKKEIKCDSFECAYDKSLSIFSSEPDVEKLLLEITINSAKDHVQSVLRKQVSEKKLDKSQDKEVIYNDGNYKYLFEMYLNGDFKNEYAIILDNILRKSKSEELNLTIKAVKHSGLDFQIEPLI